MFPTLTGEKLNSRKARQQSAKKRAEAYAALSIEEKLARLNSRPGASKRERARLEKQKKETRT